MSTSQVLAEAATTRSPLPRPTTGVVLKAWLKAAKQQPIDFFIEIQKACPSIAFMKLFGRKQVLLMEPDLIRYVLQTNQKSYTKGSQYRLIKMVLGNGLVTSEGELWRKQRRLIQPSFHKHYINTLFADMVSCTNVMLDEWERAGASGQPIYVVEEMMKATLRIICKTMLSSDVNADADELLNSVVFIGRQIAVKAMNPFQLPIWFPSRDNREFISRKKLIDKIIYGIIDQHRCSERPRGDLLDMLMDARYEGTAEPIPDELIRDEIVTIFIAGHSTTATALAWTMYLLSENPKVYEKLKAEVDSVLGINELELSQVPRLQYTKNVFKEAMRLFPSVWVIVRRAAEDNLVGEFLVKKGTDVLISPYLVHRDPKIWKDADKFIPERWDTEEVKAMDNLTYFPFAAGPRMCVGNNFALLEADVILAKLIQRFTFEYLGEVPAEMEASTNLRIKNRAPMRIQRRVR